MPQLTPRLRLVLTIAFLVALAGGWWWYNQRSVVAIAPPNDALADFGLEADAPLATPTPTVALIGVDVIGAVQQPGVYFLVSTARVQDAVVAAGGLAPTADREAINLAAHLTDAQQLLIPHIGAARPSVAAAPAAASNGSTSALININTADATALAALPGIGAAMAERIIEYRVANGPFASVDDLQNVRGIGATLFAKLKDGATTGE